MTRASEQFLRDRAAGKRPDVPDSVWYGADCWILEFGCFGWKISKRGLEAMNKLDGGKSVESVA